MSELDKMVGDVSKPRQQIKAPGETSLLDSKLILQSYLDYLSHNGAEHFPQWVNEHALHLVSTVHPNETERNTNLMHYASVYEQYSEWRRNFDSLQTILKSAPEYRLRREALNQLRRTIKGELESVWQSDHMRVNPIPVQSEATRILERYRVIFKAYPIFLKFVKQLAKEALYLYKANEYSKDAEWVRVFRIQMAKYGETRYDKLKAIKMTFRELKIAFPAMRVSHPVITFGTWKGGDRDGNPFVVASFTNQTLVDQKEVVLRHYISIARELVDKLTPSLRHVKASPKLIESVKKDAKIFPYLSMIKPTEPYRGKIRYILEKLENTLSRVVEVKKQAGETVKPLLGLTLPGPTGYNSDAELCDDIDVLYRSLTEDGAKSQARSLTQDLHILIHTFGLHLTSIDFRQTSEKNTEAVQEFLKAVNHDQAAGFPKMEEKARQKLLLELILSTDITMDPWMLPILSKTTRDTLETLLIFADAAKTDRNAVGKFIISMCQFPSDIMNVLFLMKLAGMLETDGKRITVCPFDVTGLFETIKDLIDGSKILEELLSIKVLRDYVVQHRHGRITPMLGYSDSVRDGSSLASDSQLCTTVLELKALETRLNAGQPRDQQIKICFYRGRGDTLPRGYGGSITKAISAQLVTSPSEDHTEQNRYLRRYFSVHSAVDHLHTIYSAHLSASLSLPPPDTPKYQRYYAFFGKISALKWHTLVQEGPVDQYHGKVYFEILTKYSILPHLPKSHFASRPVARDGVTYNIDKIRAIPFTMVLAQLREFTSAFYGTGTAFELGSQLLDHPANTAVLLLQVYLQNVGANGEADLKSKAPPKFQELLKAYPDATIAKAKAAEPLAPIIPKLVLMYGSLEAGLDSISALALELSASNQSASQLLQEMYGRYPPFRFSIENKETSLMIRNKRIVDEYTKDANAEEKKVLANSEEEAALARKWVLKINQQSALESKNIAKNWDAAELYILHLAQCKLLADHRELIANRPKAKTAAEKTELNTRIERTEKQIQMSILAVSEALGFAG